MILPAKEIIIDKFGWETDSKDGPIPVGIAAAAAARYASVMSDSE